MCDSIEEGDLGLGSSLTALTATRVRLVGMQGDAVWVRRLLRVLLCLPEALVQGDSAYWSVHVVLTVHRKSSYGECHVNSRIITALLRKTMLEALALSSRVTLLQFFCTKLFYCCGATVWHIPVFFDVVFCTHKSVSVRKQCFCLFAKSRPQGLYFTWHLCSTSCTVGVVAGLIPTIVNGFARKVVEGDGRWLKPHLCVRGWGTLALCAFRCAVSTIVVPVFVLTVLISWQWLAACFFSALASQSIPWRDMFYVRPVEGKQTYHKKFKGKCINAKWIMASRQIKRKKKNNNIELR